MTSHISRIIFTENDLSQERLWHSENHSPAPKKIILADDQLSADAAYKLACEGSSLLWRGDYHNARQLLQALARRIDRKPKKEKKIGAPIAMPQAFHLHRQAQAQRARILGSILIELDASFQIHLRRAPNVQAACSETYAGISENFVISLRELLGVIGAHEWRDKGVTIPSLENKIHPYYGVFSPIRGEYLELIAQAPLPELSATTLAFDIGTGTGVISALLAKRGIAKIIASDQDERALACAEDNLNRLGYAQQVELVNCDLFPEGKADLIVCNPPWLPAKANSSIEYALYDPESRMLKGFLNGVSAHLKSTGQAWLIMSDFAEQLKLRSRAELLSWIEQAGLRVIERHDIRPQHSKIQDSSDALHQARAAEVTSLWRLTLA
jgi:methylase of polypeptide subunit release factors